MQFSMSRLSAAIVGFLVWSEGALAAEYDLTMLESQCLITPEDYSRDLHLAYCRVLAEVAPSEHLAMTALKQMADIQQNAGIRFRAEEVHDEIVARYSDQVQARQWRARFNQDSGYYREAAEDWRAILDRTPDDMEAIVAMVVAIAASEDLEDGLAYFARGESIDPDHPDLYLARGQALHFHGRDEAALKDFDKAVALAPERADVHVARANFLKAIEEYDQAYLGYRDAVEREPLNVEARFNIARFDYLIAETRPELFLAAAELKQVYKQNPTLDTAAFLLANATSRLGKTHESLEYHRQFLKRASAFIGDYKNFLKQEGYYAGEIDYERNAPFWVALRDCVEDQCRMLPELEWLE